MNTMHGTKRNRHAMVLSQLFLLLLQSRITDSAIIARPGCPDRCGEILIPYPFGIGTNCSMSDDFNVTCNAYERPYMLGKGNHPHEILNISLLSGQLRTNAPISFGLYNKITKEQELFQLRFDFAGTPFWLNTEKNKFRVTGCNTLAYFTLDENNYTIGCLSTCDSVDALNKYGSFCSGIGCCQTDIPKVPTVLSFTFDDRYNNSQVYNISPCSYAMIVESNFVFNTTSFLAHNTLEKLFDVVVPVVFDWTVGNTTCKDAQSNNSSYACKSDHSVCSDYKDGPGYHCNCSDGYEGNPYLQGGCQDIDECAIRNPCSKQAKCYNLPGKYRCSCSFGWHALHNNPENTCELNLALIIGSCVGVVALLLLGFAIYIILERRNLLNIRAKYFQQHGGWILLENIKSNQGFGFIIFTKEQVEQATNNFDNANIIGHGGNGTVYKGILKEQAVAIKKCKIADESKKKEFGKEMLILSQISHKNIVKLLGCCLEVEVPMLVYEFIPNGTLFHYIHCKNPGLHISLTVILRIALESAEALAYLHTSASPSILHGDVKSANILLDKNYTAKISDFGASILAPTDEVQFVTVVQGTCGYLDPEYLQSCQLTDKSDVYSFGVVLLELLTSKPVIDFDAPEEEKSLSSRFLKAVKENRMEELLDDEIIKHADDMEIIKKVSTLAVECLSMKGEERPMMKEVVEELYRISKMKQHPWEEEYDPKETRTLLSEEAHHDMEIDHTRYSSM